MTDPVDVSVAEPGEVHDKPEDGSESVMVEVERGVDTEGYLYQWTHYSESWMWMESESVVDLHKWV